MTERGREGFGVCSPQVPPVTVKEHGPKQVRNSEKRLYIISPEKFPELSTYMLLWLSLHIFSDLFNLLSIVLHFWQYFTMSKAKVPIMSTAGAVPVRNEKGGYHVLYSTYNMA